MIFADKSTMVGAHSGKDEIVLKIND